MIEAGLVALLRALGPLAAVSGAWGVLLMGFGAVNMVIGNMMALRQTQVKRLLAYSSIAQVGYMLLGIGIGVYAGELAGAQGGLFHVLTPRSDEGPRLPVRGRAAVGAAHGARRP